MILRASCNLRLELTAATFTKMPVKDHHQEPFDEGTLVKLSIFEDYAKEALPVFINRKGASEIHIFDFFAGPGYDVDESPRQPDPNI